MKFAAPVLAAVAAMYPTVEGYSLFGPSLFEPALTFSPMVRRSRAMSRPRYFDDTFRQFDDTFKQLSPRYEIVNNEQQLQIAMDVPGVKMEDVDVSLEDGGKLLTIRGSRRARTDDNAFTSKFSQSFSLDPVIDVDNLTAHLVDGVLTVSAPKDMKRLEQNIKSIPVLESAPPAIETPKLSASETEEPAAEDDVATTEEKDDEVVDLDEENVEIPVDKEEEAVHENVKDAEKEL